jgi:hypothetical protein
MSIEAWRERPGGSQMRVWSLRTVSESASAAPEEAIVVAVDAALGFVAGQRWVPQHMAAALFETVRDVTRAQHAPEHLGALIDAWLEKCNSDPILAGVFTDALLDIRNAASHAELTRSGVR